jgi:putative effector of murein hydrolase LrgA (UPF0299 family)
MIKALATLLVFQTLEKVAYPLSYLLSLNAAGKPALVSLELLKHWSLLFMAAGVGIMVRRSAPAQEVGHWTVDCLIALPELRRARASLMK